MKPIPCKMASIYLKLLTLLSKKLISDIDVAMGEASEWGFRMYCTFFFNRKKVEILITEEECCILTGKKSHIFKNCNDLLENGLKVL